MLTGEYAVLDGASCFAIPTKYGQSMTVKNFGGTDLKWKSLDHEGNVWFECDISLYDFSAVKTTDEAMSQKLKKVLKSAVRLNCEFLDKWKAFKVETKLEFPLNWGLGSSSTLIYLVAQWADISPLELYFRCENGSGYDVACAGAEGPIEYWATEDEVSYSKVKFAPKYLDNLYFVHLNEKQDSAQGIKDYLKKVKDKATLVKTITKITEEIQEAKTLNAFDKLIIDHEDAIAKHTGFTKVKEQRFSDYWGAVKSLGAWGGDFVLATSDKSKQEVQAYFKSKGYETCLTYKELAL
jgi:mevalonate kinase